jgi:SAM-dependent methyltransferase
MTSDHHAKSPPAFDLLATSGQWSERLAVARQFFAVRAAGWEDRFPDDGPAYSQAIAALDLVSGGRVLDAACGTGRALPIMRSAVGSSGTVIGLDLTPEMLLEAARRGRGELVLGDVDHLPLPDGCLDAVFGAGLIPHLDDPDIGMTELARVTRPGGGLALFHPVGRAALAARHGRLPDPDDIRAEPAVRALLRRTGWVCNSVDDGPDRYLVTATRQPQ